MSDGGVCEICWASLIKAQSVPRPRRIAKLHVAFHYDDRLREIVHHFKFHHGSGLAGPLAEKMVEQLKTRDYFPDKGILLPVPDHPVRRRERGFNPALELAKNVAGLWKLCCEPSLAVRLYQGPHQSQLPRNKRIKSLKGAFNVARCDDRDTPLILVDDVIHTGTTLARLAEAARRAGWSQIEAICLCQ